MRNSRLSLAILLSGAALVSSSSRGQTASTREGQILSSSPGQTSSGTQTMPAMGADSAPSIRIGPGDLLTIQVFETPELSGTARVNQDGLANLPVLGAIRLAGLSANDASRTVEQDLKSRGLLLDPHVSIFVTEYASQGASVIGEVRSPGVYPTLGSRRLLDMISLAGGVAPTAGKVISIIHQGDPEHPRQIALQPTPASLHLQENPVIDPGDTIVVAKSGVIYIIGDVLKPGGFLVDNNERLSVIDALSLAGGMNKTAALSKTKLIRKVPAGREEVDLDLKHILFGKQADVMVSDGDILFVPSSVGKTILYRGSEAAIALATQFAIYSRQ
jgi:polysaccharide export outer membrane protein